MVNVETVENAELFIYLSKKNYYLYYPCQFIYFHKFKYAAGKHEGSLTNILIPIPSLKEYTHAYKIHSLNSEKFLQNEDMKY